MRKSRFNIITPLGNDSEDFIFTHGYTGAVDIVNKEIAEKFFNDFDINNLNQSEITHLKERGYLTDLSDKEELNYVSELVEKIYEFYKTQLTVLIAPNLDCSFRCTYCFQRDLQNKITKTPSHDLARVMNMEQVDKIYLALKDKMHNSELKINKEITLYGGEALQQSNLEIVNYIVSEGLKLGFKFSAISNGYELDKFHNLLGNGLEKVQITIDGFEDVHDSMRVERNGNSSFYKIVKNIDKAIDTDAIIDIAFNFSEKNANNISKLIQFFNKKGWTKKPNVIIHGNQIFDLKTNLTAFQENYDEIIDLRLLARENNIMLSNSTTKIKELFEDKLNKGLPLPLKPSYCSANTGMYIFAPDDNIYSCWEAVGESISKVGSYFPEFSIDKTMMDRWMNRVATRIDECHKCEYVMFCGGGCTINAFRKNGKFMSPYCDSFQTKFSDLMLNIFKDKKTNEYQK